MPLFDRKDKGKAKEHACSSEISAPRVSWLRRLTGTSSDSPKSTSSVPIAAAMPPPGQPARARANTTTFAINNPQFQAHTAGRSDNPLRANTTTTNDSQFQAHTAAMPPPGQPARARANTTAFATNDPQFQAHTAGRPGNRPRAQTTASYPHDFRVQWAVDTNSHPAVFPANPIIPPAAIPQSNPVSNIGINTGNHPRGYDPTKKSMRERIDNLMMAEHAFDTMQIPYSLKLFSDADETPHIHFNIGQIHLFLCAPSLAREHFERAVEMDSWFCAAWMMLGALRFNEGEYVQAKQAWNDALKCLRGRKTIDYEQLGLAYTVHYEEVLWNRAAAERALELGGSAGMRPACVPMGAIFRVPGRLAKVRGNSVGEGTEWGFKGEGRVVGRCESVYSEHIRVAGAV
jgi:hypothetical protein